jgi:formylglycine-generating enzyme required for sulfatase activity
LLDITKPDAENLDEVFDETEEEVKDDTYRLPSKEEWEEACNINVTDELP